MNNVMNNPLITDSNIQDFATPEQLVDSASAFTVGTTFTSVATSCGNARYKESDGGSGTLTDIEHPKFLETHVYSRRWWILAMLCISVMQNSNNWISFIVCFDETKSLYSWNQTQIYMLTAWGPLLYIPMAICLPYLNKILTFRALMTISNLLMCIGCVIRSFPPKDISSNNVIIILAHCGQILNAIAAPMVFATPQQLSAIWFPKQQRTTSTSIAVVSGYSGTLLSYLTIYYVNKSSDKLLTVLRLEAVFSLAFFIIVLSDQIWYNDIPVMPPSVSAMLSLEKHTFSDHQQFIKYKQELSLILNNRKLHYFTFICGAYQGVICGWIGILHALFDHDNYIGFKQVYVSLIDISCILCIIFGGIIFGVINDKLYKRIKLIILTLLFISVICLFLFALLLNNHHQYENNKTVQFLAILFCVIGIFCNAGSYGVSYEAAVEIIYPSREVFAGTILTIYFKLCFALFLLLNNYLSPLCMNWIVCLIQIIACILLLFYNQQYKRLDYDDIALNNRSKTFARTPTNILPKFITPNSKSEINNNDHNNNIDLKKDNNNINNETDINQSLHSSI